MDVYDIYTPILLCIMYILSDYNSKILITYIQSAEEMAKVLTAFNEEENLYIHKSLVH